MIVVLSHPGGEAVPQLLGLAELGGPLWRTVPEASEDYLKNA